MYCSLLLLIGVLNVSSFVIFINKPITAFLHLCMALYVRLSLCNVLQSRIIYKDTV